MQAILDNYDAFVEIEGLSPDAALAETLSCYPEAGLVNIKALLRYRFPTSTVRASLKIFSMKTCRANLGGISPQHDIQTVISTRRGGIKNGALLQLLEEHGFDVFITGDKNMPNQLQLQRRPFAVLIMSAINWPIVKQIWPR